MKSVDELISETRLLYRPAIENAVSSNWVFLLGTAYGRNDLDSRGMTTMYERRPATD